jgi:hypothetical protein
VILLVSDFEKYVEGEIRHLNGFFSHVQYDVFSPMSPPSLLTAQFPIVLF